MINSKFRKKNLVMKGYSPQQWRGGKKQFFNFSKILQKYENTYQMKAEYEISLKYDAYYHQKMAIKNPPNYNLPYWRRYLWSKKGGKRELNCSIVPNRTILRYVSFIREFCQLLKFISLILQTWQLLRQEAKNWEVVKVQTLN